MEDSPSPGGPELRHSSTPRPWDTVSSQWTGRQGPQPRLLSRALPTAVSDAVDNVSNWFQGYNSRVLSSSPPCFSLQWLSPPPKGR